MLSNTENSIKVLLIGAFPPPYGGVQVHMLQLRNFLENHGHTCFVLNMGKNKDIKSKTIVSPTNSFEVAYHIWKRRDHVCHLHFGGTLHLRLILLALFANIVCYRRCAITIHSGGLPSWGMTRNYGKRVLLWMSFAFCRAIICVNSEIASYFQRIGCRPEWIYTIPAFAFEYDAITSQLPKPINLFLRDKKPILCNIGLLEPEYDLELLLRVFYRFVEKNPLAGLVMIGSGSLHEKLTELVSQLGLREKVLLTGDLEHQYAMGILSSSDCYIRASRYDGDCISLREAIHLGVPAVASDTGLRPKNTILFPIGDGDAMLECLVGLGRRPSVKSGTLRDMEKSSLYDMEKILMDLGRGL